MISIQHTEQDIFSKISEDELIFHYFNIRKIPCLICSPLRKDKHPSFSFYYAKNGKIRFRDFSTGESGGLIDLFMKLWNCTYIEAINRIGNKMDIIPKQEIVINRKHKSIRSELSCTVRDWNDDDIDYWKGYGISTAWLDYANVYPISYFFIKNEDKTTTYKADKLAYGFYEFKEGKITVKVYQPLNKKGVKWRGSHDSSVISLWTKVPEKGKCVVICSSLKDALCLWENTGMPSLAIQGEMTRISDTAVNELKKRFKNVFICLDNDKTGLSAGKKLEQETGFINVVLPQFEGGKDISDYFKILNNKKQFKTNLIKLFKDEKNRALSESEGNEFSGKDSEEIQQEFHSSKQC